MTVDEWLRRAGDHLFLSGVDDAAEQLCRANMRYGLAKIQYAEDQLGLEPRATFVGAPDATVTRNLRRWRQGFGYGGQVRWDPELAVLDSKPNGCGMLFGGLQAAPCHDAARQAASAAREARHVLDGVPLQYDLGESNHFVDGLELEQVLEEGFEERLPQHAFIIHSSGHEHRPGSPLGPGLYFDESEELRQLARVLQTPWGDLHLLAGDEARAYHDFCARVQDFNLRRRRFYGELLFGPHSSICNATHQGMREPGVFHLGSYWFEREREVLYPLTLGPDQPVYLLQPRPNLSEAALEQLGWRRRGEALGLLERLRAVDMLPHGGGYSYPQLARLARVESTGGRRTFWLEPREDGPPLKIEDARELPFAYRDLAVLQRVVDLGLGRPVARYRVSFVIKE